MPTPKLNSFTWVKDIHLFACKLALYKYHKVLVDTTTSFTTRDIEPMEILEISETLQSESETGISSIGAPFSSLKPKSHFTPPLSQITNIDTVMNMVSRLDGIGKDKNIPQVQINRRTVQH